MEIIISDSSTLILLTKSKLIDITLEYFDIVIPTSVYQEILEGKVFNYSDAFEIEDLVNKKQITVKDPKNKKLISDLKKAYKLDVGELEAIALAKEENRSVFIDDKKGIIVCKLLNIETYTAIRLLKTFYLTKIISKDQLKNMLAILKINGRYTKNDISEIKEILEE